MSDSTATSSSSSPSTIPATFAATVARYGDSLAVVDDDIRLTYLQLADEVEQFAAGLVAADVQRGDRVAIWAHNSARWITALLGVLSAGAVVVPVNTRFKGVEAADILARSRAKVLVTVTNFLGTNYVEMLRESGLELPKLETIVVASGPAPDGAMSWGELTALAGDGTRVEAATRAGELTPSCPADILFTSGTTGIPKGVVQSQAGTLAVATDWVAMSGMGHGDHYLMVNPYFHMFGLKAGILAAVVAGATMLPERIFDVDTVLARVAAENVTVLPGPPTIYQSILDHPNRDRYDLSSLHIAVTGSADIPEILIRRMLDELPFTTVISGYGLTEGGTATGTLPGDEPDKIATTVGRPRPGVELRIVGPDGADVSTGERGEVLLRSASTMLEYLDDPAATAEVLSSDGWLRTGDLGYLGDDGYLRITGRLKDMIIVGGFNVYPAEVENILARHPGIERAAVLGIPDERLGEVPMAFVAPRQGAALTPTDVIAWCRHEMANHKVPRVVHIIDALPVNASGKILKHVLRAQLEEQRREAAK